MASDPLRSIGPRRVNVPNRDADPSRALLHSRGRRPADRDVAQPREAEKPQPRGTSDPLAAQAAYLHAQALEADVKAARLRAERDMLIDRLRAQDPKRWSYTALAAALGCSRELIAQIVRRSR